MIWVTPPADPLLLNYLEDLGGRLVATEFIINQALYPLQLNGNPIEALADSMLNGSLMGTSKSRANEIIKQAKKYKAEGVIISNIFAIVTINTATKRPLINKDNCDFAPAL